MEIEIADVVVPLNGRDAGKRFIVIGAEEEYSFLADGKGRRAEKPKRKKNKHLRPEGKIGRRIAEKLAAGDKVANSEIRRALAEYAAARENEPGFPSGPPCVAMPGGPPGKPGRVRGGM